MGGFMSPPTLQGWLYAAVQWWNWKMVLGPEGLIGTVVRFMDDVFGIYAVGNSTEEQLVKAYYGGIAEGYPPPLVLNVEQPANGH